MSSSRTRWLVLGAVIVALSATAVITKMTYAGGPIQPPPPVNQSAKSITQPHPTGPKFNGPAPSKLYPEPSWAKIVQAVPAGEFVNTDPRLAHADSVWRDGSVPEYNYTVWDALYVWTGRSSEGSPFIATYAQDAVSPTVTQKFDVQFACPRDVGSLQILAIQGPLVQFASSSGVRGVFNLDTHQWSFAQ